MIERKHPGFAIPSGGRKKPYVTVTYGMAGWFALIVWWNDEGPHGFWEPWDTPYERHRDREDAVAQARELAEQEGLEFRMEQDEEAATIH